jgi:hypothetical protein
LQGSSRDFNWAGSRNLGGGVYKQRIARKGQGKSGGFRTIIFFEAHKAAFFILGFAKTYKAIWNEMKLRD